MILRRLRLRNRQPEVMDEPTLDPASHQAALRGLARINYWSDSAGILWPPVRELLRAEPGRPLRLLDVATGAGDVPLRLGRKALRAGLPLEVAGCDVSPVSVEFANRQAELLGLKGHFFTADVCRDGLPGGYDVITCSLFLHHLEQEQAVALLAGMGRAAGRLLMVNDLNRSRVGYLLAWVGSRVLSRSRVVHVDGPRSVEAAFTKAEALALAARAGLRDARIGARFPCRWLLRWSPA